MVVVPKQRFYSLYPLFTDAYEQKILQRYRENTLTSIPPFDRQIFIQMFEFFFNALADHYQSGALSENTYYLIERFDDMFLDLDLLNLEDICADLMMFFPDKARRIRFCHETDTCVYWHMYV